MNGNQIRMWLIPLGMVSLGGIAAQALIALAPWRIQLKALVAFALIVVGSIAAGWWHRRMRRHIAEHKSLLCIHCRYPLHGLPETGLCPECGKPYTFTAVRSFWTLGQPTMSTKFPE
ncbi:MAG: hypothetical protein L0Y44_12615 [Phycisphaerales bacterium]|nr:hypothetical protein [Phycisphaerales bacterium]